MPITCHFCGTDHGGTITPEVSLACAVATVDQLRADRADLIAACNALMDAGQAATPFESDCVAWDQANAAAEAAIAKATQAVDRQKS